MDVLSDILGSLDLAGSLYFTTEFTSPWGVQVPRHGNVARFHLVIRGTCWVGVAGHETRVCLETGDLVLIPHGAEHILTDAPGTPALTVDDVVKQTGFTGRGSLVFGGDDDGQPTRMLCGHFEFGEHGTHPFLSRLPPLVVVRHDEIARHAWLDDVYRAIVREVREGRPGRDAVVQRLSEVLFIQSIRSWADGAGHDANMIHALSDPHIGRGLAAIHSEPGRAWTLESLAREAQLSRTAFAERFQRRLAFSPMQYLAFWRVQHARRLLHDQQLTIESVAEQVGYRSTAAFSRVFRKWVGTSPGGYRRGHTGDPSG